MTSDDRALAYGLGTVVMWSTVATAFKLSLEHLEPSELLLWASGVSAVVLTAILAMQGRLRELRGLGRRALLSSVGFGLLNPALYYLVLFEAYDALPAQEAQALNYTWALTLTYLSVPFLKRPMTRVDGLAGLVCYGGALVIATRGRVLSLELSDPAGVGLALLSTVIWASYWILNTRDDRDPVVGQLLNFAVAVPAVAVWTWSQGSLRWPSAAGLAGAAYVGIFEMGVAFVLWLKAMRLTSSTARISNLIFISPFLSLVFIHFLLGEPIFGSTVVGLALILGGLGLQQAVHRRTQRA